MWKFLYKTLLLFLILAMLGIIGGIGAFWYFGRDLPDYQQLASYDPPVVTRIHAGNGQMFAEYATQKRVFVPIESIPKKVIDTFLAVEDKNFFSHIGLDWLGLLRAAAHNGIGYLTGKKSVMGGSTITQQVAKNFLLHRKKTLIRKIQEAILAIRIEKAYSKKKILELYLNEIYFGAGSYGVAAAALEYFGKSLEELDPSEIAFLAILPKAPNNYNPKRHPQAALARRNWGVARMLEEGLLSRAEAISAKQSPIVLRAPQRDFVTAQYFVEDVRRFLKSRYGDDTLYKGGLAVHTTLDPALQKFADQSLKEGLIAYDHRHGWHGTLTHMAVEKWREAAPTLKKPTGSDPWVLAIVTDLSPTEVLIETQDFKTGHIPFESMRWARKHQRNEKGYPYLGPELTSPSDILNLGDVILVAERATPTDPTLFTLEQMPLIEGALVALDPHTGRVLALSGGYSYERSEYNRATQANRQAGSAFKPFTYLAAMEEIYTPVSLLLDAPFVMEMSPTLGYWAPKNIEKRFFGTNTLRTAIEKSFNATVVRVAHEIGMEKIRDVARKFGIYDDLPLYLSTVLGSEETTLLQFTAAYAMLVNGGKFIRPYPVERIQDRHGKQIYQHETRACPECQDQPWDNQEPPTLPDTREQIIEPLTAYQMVSILEGAAQRGTGRKGQPKGQIVGLKTGTSNDYKDTWAIGFSRDLVVGVFVGFDNPKSLGRYNTGGSVAGPIFKSFMEKALENTPSTPFRVPEKAKFIRINRLTGVKATSKDKDTILEVFKPNQEPNTPSAAQEIGKGGEDNSPLPHATVSGIY